MMFFSVIFLILGSGVIAYILGWRPDFLEPSSYKTSRGKTDESALELLNERYARGEIDEEEYLKKKENLKS
jgi:putative membrane protein